MSGIRTPSTDRGWTLWRQDDNGHRFLISRHASQAQAQAARAELEKGCHKQMYWIEPPEAPLNGPGSGGRRC